MWPATLPPVTRARPPDARRVLAARPAVRAAAVLAGRDQSGVTAAIVDAPPLPAKDRLAIYRNAYQVRLIDALHETYPVLHGLLGDEAWVEMGEARSSHAHPSMFPAPSAGTDANWRNFWPTASPLQY